MKTTEEPDKRRNSAAVRRHFLQVLAETGSPRAAEQATGRSRKAWMSLRQQDPAFAQAWDQALDSYVEILETEADRRALCGDEEAVFYGGKQVGVRSKPSDSLLMFRLKALRPGRYGKADDPGEAVTIEIRSFAGDEVES